LPLGVAMRKLEQEGHGQAAVDGIHELIGEREEGREGGQVRGQEEGQGCKR
jgi:hypothetical protein